MPSPRRKSHIVFRIVALFSIVASLVWLFFSAGNGVGVADLDRFAEWERLAMDAAVGLVHGTDGGSRGEVVQHIVMFQFKDGVTEDVVKETSARMLGLAEQCIHPETKKPYIRASMGGKDNSIEGHQNGITHAFIVEFDNKSDRDYYVGKDPAHLAFVASIGEIVEKAIVVDFMPGVF